MPENPRAGLFRRIAAMVYDSFLLVACDLLFSAICVFVNGGEALTYPLASFILIPGFFFINFIFYAYFWTKAGQSLGMRAWKLHIRNSNNKLPSLKQCFVRYLCAYLSFFSFALGYLNIIWSSQKTTWHDNISETFIVVAPSG